MISRMSQSTFFKDPHFSKNSNPILDAFVLTRYKFLASSNLIAKCDFVYCLCQSFTSNFAKVYIIILLHVNMHCRKKRHGSGVIGKGSTSGYKIILWVDTGSFCSRGWKNARAEVRTTRTKKEISCVILAFYYQYWPILEYTFYVFPFTASFFKSSEVAMLS